MNNDTNNANDPALAKPRQVFIIGSKRSGTTWTLWLLANHPSIVGLLQTDLIETLEKLEKWWLGVHQYHKGIIAARENDDTESGEAGSISYERRNLNECLDDEDLYKFCTSYANHVYNSSLKAKPGAQIVVESQPENIEYLDLLQQMYPDACFLHIIRDPRSVFSSWKSVARTWSNPDVFADHPASFSRHWQKDIETGRSMVNRPQNYREVRYESLLENGAQVLAELYQWLGVDADLDMAEKAIEACSINKLRAKAEMPKGFFRKGKKQGWRDELSQSDVRVIEYLLSDLMDELGYDRVNQGKLGKPLKLAVYDTKMRILTAIKSGFIWNFLRGIKRRLLAAGT